MHSEEAFYTNHIRKIFRRCILSHLPHLFFPLTQRLFSRPKCRQNHEALHRHSPFFIVNPRQHQNQVLQIFCLKWETNVSLSPTWYGKPITSYPVTQQTHSLPVPPLSPSPAPASEHRRCWTVFPRDLMGGQNRIEVGYILRSYASTARLHEY